MGSAAVIILTGQSLNLWRGSTRVLDGGWASAKIPVGGGTQPEMDMFPLNNDHAPDANEFTSAVTQTETVGGQSPIAGIASGMSSSGYDNIYLFSAARASADYDVLQTRGSIQALHYGIQRLCELAVVDGHTVDEIVFYHAHGERAAVAARTEAQYEADTIAFLRRCRLLAAQHKGNATYVAPIFFSMPLQNKVPTAGSDASQDIAIKNAIKNTADTLADEGIVYILPTFSLTDSSGADFTHGDETDYIRRGEYVGLKIADVLTGTAYSYEPLRMTSVTRSGDTVTVQFSDSIARDASPAFGSGLFGTNVDGWEYYDNGSAIVVSSAVYSGDTATLTLASTPAGTDAQQVLRLGLQATAASGTAVTAQNGHYIRKDQTAIASTVDVGWDFYDYAIQEEISGFPYSYTPPAAPAAPAASVYRRGGLMFISDYQPGPITDIKETVKKVQKLIE